MQIHNFLGFFDLDALIFGELDDSDDTKWDLLLWSIGLNSQLRSDLQRIKKEYVPTVLALMFLLQVKSNWILTSNLFNIKISKYSFHADWSNNTIDGRYGASCTASHTRTENGSQWTEPTHENYRHSHWKCSHRTHVQSNHDIDMGLLDGVRTKSIHRKIRQFNHLFRFVLWNSANST